MKIYEAKMMQVRYLKVARQSGLYPLGGMRNKEAKTRKK